MHHSFVLPKPFFDLDWLRSNDYYFNQKEVMELRGSKVLVRDHGEMIMLSSYSYLGLLGHPRINKASQDAVSSFGTGTHGVRLLAGTTSVHVELERELARLKSTEAAVAFSSGYVTNVSAITAIVGRHDHIFCDRLNHASIVDGCTLSGATVHRFRHNDTSDLRRLLESVPPESNKLVIVDAVLAWMAMSLTCLL